MASTRELFGLLAENCIGYGASSIVYGVDVVFKAPYDEQDRTIEMISREREVYTRLGRHQGILTYYGTLANHTILSRAQHGTIRNALRNKAYTPKAKLQWIVQIARAFEYIHSRGVLHGDICCNNIFLDDTLSIKVGDFAGSQIDEKKALACYGASHLLPNAHDVSVKTELFALGSTFYEIITGEQPFRDLDEDEIEQNFEAGVFPDTRTLPTCQSIIQKCWRQQYSGVDELLSDLQTESHGPNSSSGSIADLCSRIRHSVHITCSHITPTDFQRFVGTASVAIGGVYLSQMAIRSIL